jgi:hypothetical protein
MSARRLLGLFVLWLAISAPTPGSVGSCSGDRLDRPADLSQYCQQREQLICVRRFLRKEITAAARDACRWSGIDLCAQRSFAKDCQPTQRQADACLNALASFDTLHTPDDQVADCNTKALCNVPKAPNSDAGAGSP